MVLKPTRVQFPGNTTERNDQYVGPPRQVTVDTIRNELRLHDGRKKGGFRFPNLDQLRRLFVTRDSEFGGLTFADEQKGLLTRIGKAVYQVRKIVGNHGIQITNEDGTGGDIGIGLPVQFLPNLTPITNANTANKTGFYVVTKGPDSNLPAEWLTTANVFLEVMSFEDAPGTMIQIARNADAVDHKVYVRIRNAGVFTSWGIKAETKLPEDGLLSLVYNGVDMEQRTWSAKQLSDTIRSVVQSIQYINSSNAAVAKSYNHLFTADGSGAGTTQVIMPAMNLATDDRIEIVAGATAAKLPGGDAQAAEIEIEKSDLTWNLVANLAVTTLPNEEAKSAEVIYRFVKSATGYQPADELWNNTTANVVATLTGRIRVTVGAANAKGARVSRWR